MRGGSPNDLAARVPHLPAEEAVRLMMGDYATDTDHPWHRLERGEISMAECWQLNGAALEALGIDMSSGRPEGRRQRPDWGPNSEMVELIVDLKAAGIATALLTNNAKEFRPMWWPILPFEEMFDAVVDSSAVGMRKPNPAIYELTASLLGHPEPHRIAFADDVASNLVPSSALGWHSVHVTDGGSSAIAELRRLAGW